MNQEGKLAIIRRHQESRRRWGRRVPMLSGHLLSDRSGRGAGLRGSREMAAEGGGTGMTRRRNVTWACVTRRVLGVPQEEFGQAAKWFREAAEQGDPAAQFNLGVLYETGMGVTQNYAEVVRVVSRGGGTGRTSGAVQPGRLLRDGPGGAARLRRKPWKWYLAAAEAGSRARAMQSRPVLPDRSRRGTERRRKQ